MPKKINIIEPTKHNQSQKKKLNVCAYARVSTDSIEQKDSYENQLLFYEEMIKRNPNYNYIGIFADEAISGTTDKRPNFQRMIKYAESGYIDVIYTKSISRFSRNVADLLKYCEILRNHNVNVIFEENSIDLLSAQGTLMLTILGAVAQMEVENTSAHVNWTLQNKIRKGEYVGRANPLGYDVVDNQMIINEEEAETVRYIYRRYLEGAGGHVIAKELEAMGAKTKNGNTTWYGSTVMNIIKNEKYKGVLLQGKTKTINPIGKVRKKNEGEGVMCNIEDDHEAIISIEDWNKAQEITKQRSVIHKDGKLKGTTNNSNQSVFTSKLVCGYCGKNYFRRVSHAGSPSEKIIWSCGTYAKKGKAECPKCKSVDEDYLKQSIVGMIKNLIDDNEAMFYLSDESLDKLLKDTEKKENLLEKQLSSYYRNYNKKMKMRSKLTDLLLEEKLSDEDYNEKREVLTKEIEQIQEKIDSLNSEIKNEEVSLSNRKQLIQYIKDGKAEGFNKELFELLVERIIIGGKRSDGVDDPKSLHYELKDFNLDTLMSSKIVDGYKRYYSEYDIEEASKKAKKNKS
ncbi:MAG: recombinase family protein [Clostridiales bacterium]|nr:recombinase family protein [Clostridiales bacterium]